MYGTPTTDDSRPGIKAKTTKKPSTLEPIPVGDPEVAASNSSVVVAVKTTAQNAKTVGRFILCGECAKPRVCYKFECCYTLQCLLVCVVNNPKFTSSPPTKR